MFHIYFLLRPWMRNILSLIQFLHGTTVSSNVNKSKTNYFHCYYWEKEIRAIFGRRDWTVNSDDVPNASAIELSDISDTSPPTIWTLSVIEYLATSCCIYALLSMKVCYDLFNRTPHPFKFVDTTNKRDEFNNRHYIHNQTIDSYAFIENLKMQMFSWI